MIEFLLDFCSWLLIIVGGMFCLIGAIGLIRLPDIYCRIHASGLIDTVGVAFILFGLAFQSEFGLALAKLSMILIFVLFTSPTSCHALCRATLYGGLFPTGGDELVKDLEKKVSSPETFSSKI